MLLYWIWFAELREISLLHKRRILEQLGDPEEIYKSSDWVYEKLQIPEKELEVQAEAFAMRKGNRSARCAEQFINSLL